MSRSLLLTFLPAGGVLFYAAQQTRSVEQNSHGTRPPAEIVASFDGLGVGFVGPDSAATLRNPSDNSLAVGPNHIVQIVNSRFAVFTKKGAMFDTTGRVLRGPVPTNRIWTGLPGRCEPGRMATRLFATISSPDAGCS